MGRWRVSICTAIGHNAPADGESSNQLLSKDQSAGSHIDNNTLERACTLSAGDVECATFSQLFTPGRVAILFKTVFRLSTTNSWELNIPMSGRHVNLYY